uniref:Uncharacterized protein n=1 Tax=Arundo donax TaxID=35708 RepID=A0A0A9CX14_ARUDO
MRHFKFKIKCCQYHLLRLYHALSVLLKPVLLNKHKYKPLAEGSSLHVSTIYFRKIRTHSSQYSLVFEGVFCVYLHHVAYKYEG